MRYFAETLPGIEEIIWLEIESRLPNPVFVETLFVKEKRGIILFDAGGETKLLAQLRTAVSVSAFAFIINKLERNTQDLREVTKLVSSSPAFEVAINQAMQFHKQTGVPTYRIYSNLSGKYPYHKGNLAKAVAFGMERRYPDWQQSSQNPRLEISIRALGSQILCGVRLTDPDMHTTFSSAVELSSDLPPSIAAAMAQLSQPDATDVVLNPVSEDGLLLMERRLAGPYQQMIAFAPNSDAYERAQTNVDRQRKEAPHDTTITQQHFLDSGLDVNSVNKVLVDMTAVKTPIPAFLAELARVVGKNGRIILYATNYAAVKNNLRQIPNFTLTAEHSVYIHGNWGRIYVVET